MSVVKTAAYLSMVEDLLKQYNFNQFLPSAIAHMERKLENIILTDEKDADFIDIDSGMRKNGIPLELRCIFLVKDGDIAPFWLYLPRDTPRKPIDQTNAALLRKKVMEELGWT